MSQPPEGDAAPLFPRLVAYAPPNDLHSLDVEDPARNAQILRHDVKGHLSAILLSAEVMRRGGDGWREVPPADLQELITSLVNSSAGIAKLIDQVQLLNPQPPIDYTGPRPPSDGNTPPSNQRSTGQRPA
jgi:hypothetical protein